MRLVLQRITSAQVTVDGQVVGRAGPGLCVFLAVGKDDGERQADDLAEKVLHLRVFEDSEGKMNRSVSDAKGDLLIVSEFTLYGDCTKGRRPSFTQAAAPAEAKRLCDYFIGRLKGSGLKVATGRFQAKMDVALTNDGPVTFILEG